MSCLGLLGKKQGTKQNVNTVLDNYRGTPRLNIFHALVSYFKNKNLKMHKEGRSEEDQSYRRGTQIIN